MIDYEKIIRSVKDLYNSGKTQQEIANLAGFTQKTVSKIISEENNPSSMTVETLCKLIKVIQNSNLTIDGEILAETKKININSNNTTIKDNNNNVLGDNNHVIHNNYNCNEKLDKIILEICDIPKENFSLNNIIKTILTHKKKEN